MAVIGIIISILTAQTVNSANNEMSAVDISKNYSGIVCHIFVELEVIGENYFQEPKQVKRYTEGSCFLIKGSDGKKHILTVAHIAKPKNDGLLKAINKAELYKSTVPINFRLRDVWKTVSEIKFKQGKVAFKKSGLGHSLENVPMDLDFNSSDTHKGWQILEVILEKFDQNLDLASLQLKDKSRYQYLQFGKFGDSNKLKLGESVHAIGNPLSHNLTILSGQVAHSHIQQKENDLIYKFIYTSEMLSFGSSGEPLFNNLGKIVGIAVRVNPNPPHFGIFVPANTIKEFLKSN